MDIRMQMGCMAKTTVYYLILWVQVVVEDGGETLQFNPIPAILLPFGTAHRFRILLTRCTYVLLNGASLPRPAHAMYLRPCRQKTRPMLWHRSWSQSLLDATRGRSSSASLL